ncbi:MAG: hypothetical protein A3B89_04250 [Candidatus Buchananbacteria bacterium RIFCSPHIGHO2_02_FULL_40_13]|uniref:Peptidase C39-like domain-containing protein n=1 Tax=Candidatus Buchananbacteria bacterium RIFCSPLOWO2_01_FULL_39_33 TaxID=1797543 RepID=A0A1G1YMB8_9BACT|nr:MAG: hypothetical protein A2820_01955 [Candidatus Buchananbacteria bacterium RIFCSPHIGHO2_01_FULL_40_35]OGY50889.1 MAG: hypothetical protein A3B89_04250 [Candidatus Buchananbacteria bacterium RIFCSPHIGHO2_02_FULL_40_13]OGY52956.1 MAG: hypothetical protein A3A02_04425 [Candidatus Buchananbacteria bacterium RIFCSPLOWO2_01_FULL_39_33]
MPYKIVVIFILLLFLTGCLRQSPSVIVNLPAEEVKQQAAGTLPVIKADNNISDASKTTLPAQVAIPAKLELKVAFAPQAPFANWDELHEEACEEASIITAAKYFSHQPLDEKIMDEEIYKLADWEGVNGYKIDLSAAETAQVLKNYYQLNAKVVEDVSVDRIKYELSRGNLVIVPAAGRELQNPYFRTPGPIYHMLVIRGYDNDEFITNEVGTKRGDGFRYKYQRLIDAVHDWNPAWSHYEVTDEQMSTAPKRMVVVTGS